MAMTGFDPALVSGSIIKVKDAYNDLVAALGTEMQINFVDPMTNYWACPDAQTFFVRNFKPAIDDLLQQSHVIFESVVNSMNSAGQAWARQTGATWSIKSFGGALKTIDVSNIKENINGVRGVDEEQANSTAERLNTIASNAEAALTKASLAVQNCGFIGRDQEQRLLNSLGTIKNKVNDSSAKLTSATKTAINDTVSAYGTLAVNVEQAFTAE